MGPDPKSQVRWGLGASLAAVAVVAVLALVPDPLFRHRAVATTLDDVEGIARGSPVYFRGASVGEVRRVALDPAGRNFAVSLSVLKAWRPSACNYVAVSAANPFTAPRIDLISLETPAATCSAALAAATCTPVGALGDGGRRVTGCRRAPDLIQTASAAVGEAAAVARSANAMARRLQAMLPTGAAAGGGVDMGRMARDAAGTVAALNGLSTQLGASLKPGQGDVALTLANVRRLTGRVSDIDMGAINGTIRETNALIARNQESIAGLLAEGRGTTAQTRALLEGLSASMVQTSANLATVSDNMAALTERLAADPTFAVRGAKYADPPTPGGGK